MKYIVYLDESGNPVAYTVFASIQDAPPLSDGQIQFEENLPASFDELCYSWRIKNGVFQNVGSPLRGQVWDKVSESWFYNVSSLKSQKWHEVKQHRDSAENGGFVWDGSRFDSTPISQSRIQGAAQLATLAMINNQPFGIDWTLADNSVRTLNVQEMIAVGMAMGQHINACHTRARQLRSLIEAAQTKEEVEAIYWE